MCSYMIGRGFVDFMISDTNGVVKSCCMLALMNAFHEFIVARRALS